MDTRVAASSVFAEKASTAMKQSRTAKEGKVRKRFIVFSPVDLGAETSGVRRHYHKARHKFSTEQDIYKVRSGRCFHTDREAIHIQLDIAELQSSTILMSLVAIH